MIARQLGVREVVSQDGREAPPQMGLSHRAGHAEPASVSGAGAPDDQAGERAADVERLERKDRRAQGAGGEEGLDLLLALEKVNFKILAAQLAESAERLSTVQLKRPYHTVPMITLTGEIFVRRDALSRQYLTESLAEKGFATVCAPVSEWIYYCHYLTDRGFNQDRLTVAQRFKLKIRNLFQRYDERRIKAILSASRLVQAEAIDVAKVIKNAAPYISPDLPGEAILTIGGSLSDVVTHSCGVIAIGPFGCMPNRISEAILGEIMTAQRKLATDPKNKKLQEVLADIDDLPFLAIESDGSPFPQLINAKLETFLLRADRFHRHIMAIREKS